MEVDTDPYGLGVQTHRVQTTQVTIGNTPPEAVPKPYEAAVAGGNQTIQLSGEDPDVDQAVDDFQFAIAEAPANGRIATLGIVNGQANYEPDPGFTGMDSFAYTVADGDAVSAPARVDVYVYAGWAVEMDVTGADVGTLVLGQEAGASDGQDALDAVLPEGTPPPGKPFAGFPFAAGFLQRSIHSESARSEWTVQVFPAGRQITVSWTPETVPEAGLFIWQRYGNGEPDFRTAMDMRETESVVVAAGAGMVEFGISQSLMQSYSLQAGYNLVSLPFEPQNPDPAATFQTPATREAGAPVYAGKVYRLAGPAGNLLHPVGELEACVAYWLYLPTAETLTVYGTPAGTDPHLVANQWLGVGFRNRDAMSEWRGGTHVMWVYDTGNRKFSLHDPGSPLPIGTGCLLHYSDPAR
jgi:hypothetical protein